MPWEWSTYVHEDWNEGRRELAAIRAAFRAVTDAVRVLPEGQRVDPVWPRDIAEMAAIYQDEAAQLQREKAKEAADRVRDGN